MLKRWVIGTCGAMAALVPAVAGPGVLQPASGPDCKLDGSLMRLTGVGEASGLVASRVTPGRLWTHNDSGKPEIIALDSQGIVSGRVSLTSAVVQDWEAIGSAPCGNGACLYVGDIGDNTASRREVTVYRVPEPANAGGTAAVDGVFRASYPDGAHDAEALLVAPDGSLYIVTKGETGPVALYRFPRELRAGTTVRLERVGAPLSNGRQAANARVTDGAISPDGEQVVLRTRAALTFYRASEFLKGDFREVRSVDLRRLGEPQGEGVAFGPSNTVYVAGEGGGKRRPGTLGILSCVR